MLDVLAPLAGLVVGVLVVVAVNGLRRGRPAPVVAPRVARAAAAPPPRPHPAPSAPGAALPDHGIRVNHPGSAPAPAAPAAPPPPPPVIEPPVAPPSPAEVATVVAPGPDLAEQPVPAAPGGHPRGRLDLADGSAGLELGDAPVSLGRGTDQDLRVVDARASRHHAVVRRRSKGRPGWEVEDAGSANGTQLNGHTIPDGRVAPLRDGDRIGIGDTVVVYSEVAAPAPAEPARPSPDDDATRIGP